MKASDPDFGFAPALWLRLDLEAVRNELPAPKESCWRSFKLRLRTSERQCEEESEKSHSSRARFA